MNGGTLRRVPWADIYDDKPRRERPGAFVLRLTTGEDDFPGYQDLRERALHRIRRVLEVRDNQGMRKLARRLLGRMCG